MSAVSIPYADIDCEIRTLVALLNEFPDISTVSSCAGHQSPSAEAGIVFKAETKEAAERLLVALRPLLGWRG
jgi:tRNA(Phe) wybutosine-synthesizing methylase Tyw3